MRRAGVSDLIKMGIFTRQTAPRVRHSHELEFTDTQIERINAIIARKKWTSVGLPVLNGTEYKRL